MKEDLIGWKTILMLVSLGPVFLKYIEWNIFGKDILSPVPDTDFFVNSGYDKRLDFPELEKKQP